MENASKALIIAGSIVLAILIIGLGMYFYNQGNANSKGVQMTEYEINNVNSKFSVYEGKMSSDKVLELLETVVAYNASVGTDGYGIFIGYCEPDSNNENTKPRRPQDSIIYADEAKIVDDFYTSGINLVKNQLSSLFVSGSTGGGAYAQGIFENSVEKEKKTIRSSNGVKINNFLLGTTSGKPYYTTLKKAFSDKTHNYVGVSYYEKGTGLLRAMMIYHCKEDNSLD